MRAGFWIYIGRRVLHTVALIVGITLITFVLSHIVPTDPAAIYAGLHPRASQIAQARKLLGLDKPLYVQYLVFLKGLVTGHWGISLRTHREVLHDLMTFLPPTLELVVASTFLATIFGIPLGVYASRRPGSAVDTVVRLSNAGFVSIPAFWLALLLQIVFFGHLHLLPLGGQLTNTYAHALPRVTGFPILDALITGHLGAFGNALWHLILPSLALGAYSIGFIARMTRATMLDVLSYDYIRLAMANGYSTLQIYFRYALKNALGTALTALGLIFAFSLTGDFYIELIFFWQGLGTYAVNSIQAIDTPAILGVVVLVASGYAVTNLIVDLIRATIDPRISIQ